MDIGKNLREYRKAAGLTQGDIAERLQVSKNTVCKWETGITMPGLDALKQMADLYQVSMDALCGRVTPATTGSLTKYDVLRFILELKKIGASIDEVEDAEHERNQLAILMPHMPWLADFFVKYNNVYELCENGTLDRSILDDWIAQQYERMSKEIIKGEK